MPKPLIHVLFLLCVTTFSFAAFANEEAKTEEATADASEQTAAADDKAEAADEAPQAENAKPAANEDKTTAAATENSNGKGDERSEAITARFREIVKKLDNFDRKGVEFPVRSVANGMRAEFMRRTEGKTDMPWYPKKNLSPGDFTILTDNMELFVTYGETVLQMMNRKMKPMEATMMAAKAVIDQCNSSKRPSGRTLASLNERPDDMTPAGKTELSRRKRMLGGLVAGDDYTGINAKKADEIGKKYTDALKTAAKEYEKFASMMMGAGGGGFKGSKSAKKK